VKLGHLLVGFAILDVVAAWLLARGLPEDSSPERQRALRLVLAAAIVSGIGLCLVALFVPSVAGIPLI
jgi:hypothetical protein